MSNQIQVAIDVPATMRDGTVLRANIYQPQGATDLPVLLTRLPYGKDYPMGTGFLDPLRAAQAGYIVVVQDVRGRYHSEGEWEPFVAEFNDGYDTVEWCATLPGSNARVAMFGASYFGMTQWQAAVEKPPHLVSLFPAISWGNHLNGTSRRGGVYEWGLSAYWMLSALSLDTVSRIWRNQPEQMRVAMWEAVHHIDGLGSKGYGTLPLADLPGLKDIAPYFKKNLAQPLDSPYWKQLNITGRFDQVGVPAYLLGGWYDIFLGETLNIFQALKANRIPGSPRLIIGPWAHGFPGNVVGDQDFGLATSGLFINYREDLTALQLRWFDATVKRLPNGLTEEPPVQLFVMGANQWRYFTDWPPPEAKSFDLFLDSAGHANTSRGDGALSVSQPIQGVPDRYLYDPMNPVPTTGGSLLMPGVFPPGPKDQSVIEVRSDVMSYRTAPLSHEITVIGPVTVTLYVSSSAPDTDFVARLVDVYPDGRVYNLTDGVVRASFRNADWSKPETVQQQFLNPGQVYELTIDLWATANTFFPGHRIGLDITSSNFPRWDRNLNTGLSGLENAKAQIAQQIIYHDNRHLSVLHLMTILN